MIQFCSRQLRWLTTRWIHIAANNADAIKAPQQLDVKPKIGLEVHLQLDINSKLFSQGANCSSAPPNTQLDLLDISLPGTLPKLNLGAVESAITTALGLNCIIQNEIHFDRKNYFYTDMPAGYQITQYNSPIAKSGYLDFIVTTYHHSVIAHSQPYDVIKYIYTDNRTSAEEFPPYAKRSQIKQIQLEQDSAKTLSQTGAQGNELNNLVDYNRSGSALVEIVFEPDLTNPHEASSLIRELIMLLKALQVCNCELQEGSLRVDANVSIDSIDGEELDRQVAKRVELKNLNSIRSLNRGIASEIRRQVKELLLGNTIPQESRSYDTRSDKTMPLRLKEEAVDYRYMPEPSLPPLSLETSLIDKIRANIQEIELPSKIREQLRKDYQLDHLLIVELFDEPGLSCYFREIMVRSGQKVEYDPDTVADFLIYAIANLKRVEISPINIDLKEEDGNFCRRFSPDKMKNLFDMLFNDEISFRNAFEVMKCMLLKDDSVMPEQIVKDLNLYQTREDDSVEKACREVLTGMKNVSRRYIKTGDRKYLRMMLNKLFDLYDGRISVRKAIQYFNRVREEQNAPKD